ncbi:glycosyltransferase family 1 protein [Pontibacter sp. SGAir0037]|uniref:glycosyltransferase family 4 protein n=1 Tax=Pontibacter sp. SGAir0037 TaxID=2571030 RepID=UPI0010CD6BA2|nr:glycosyltransferase family 1 protein [Pontibacter sp. SGAir0037]QCR24549.1 glycosyltransferase family 1 protein [Pontibacter sp. SGAir0037]
MKIGFDAKRAFTNASGLGNYSRFIIDSLIQQFPQDEYILYTTKQHQLFSNFYNSTNSVHVVEPQGVWRKFSSFWRVFKLASVLKKQQLDIYHGLSNELPSNIQKSGTKAVVTIHDLIYLRYPELFKPIDRNIYNNKFRRACEQAHRIVAISEQTKQDIVNYFGTDSSKIEVIYQDCHPIFHQKCSDEALAAIKQKYSLPNHYLLCVGTLEPRKNQLNLLKAWHTSGTDLDLVFIGRQTKYTYLLKEYVAQHKLEGKVHFMPYIPFQELPAFFQQATVFAYPSVFEGFGIPIIEALNSGVPVITSKGSCFSEAGGEAAIYIEPGDVEALAQAINEVSRSQHLRQQMIEAGYTHALKFRPEHTIKQLYALYEQVLKD